MRYEGYEGPHFCRGCGNHKARVSYPCDFIKALGAWESERDHILSVVDDMRSGLKVAIINGILREVEV